MPIGENKNKKLTAKPPLYFVLQALDGIRVNYQASNIPTDNTGQPILKPLPKPWPAKLKLELSSWNGLDFFTWQDFLGGMGLHHLCTQRIVDLAKRDGWTNVKFKPIEAV